MVELGVWMERGEIKSYRFVGGDYTCFKCYKVRIIIL